MKGRKSINILEIEKRYMGKVSERYKSDVENITLGRNKMESCFKWEDTLCL